MGQIPQRFQVSLEGNRLIAPQNLSYSYTNTSLFRFLTVLALVLPPFVLEL